MSTSNNEKKNQHRLSSKRGIEDPYPNRKSGKKERRRSYWRNNWVGIISLLFGVAMALGPRLISFVRSKQAPDPSQGALKLQNPVLKEVRPTFHRGINTLQTAFRFPVISTSGLYYNYSGKLSLTVERVSGEPSLTYAYTMLDDNVVDDVRASQFSKLKMLTSATKNSKNYVFQIPINFTSMKENPTVISYVLFRDKENHNHVEEYILVSKLRSNLVIDASNTDRPVVRWHLSGALRPAIRGFSLSQEHDFLSVDDVVSLNAGLQVRVTPERVIAMSHKVKDYYRHIDF